MAANNQVYPGGYSQYQGGPVYQQQQQTNTTVVIAQPGVVVAGCVCGASGTTEDFTLLGILCCLCFFPWGLLCCLLMKERRCSGCGRRK